MRGKKNCYYICINKTWIDPVLVLKFANHLPFFSSVNL